MDFLDAWGAAVGCNCSWCEDLRKFNLVTETEKEETTKSKVDKHMEVF